MCGIAGRKGPGFPSKGELRRTIQANGLSLNKEKILLPDLLMNDTLPAGRKYILAQKGKKNYYLLLPGNLY
jgi:tyrosyl-tRNA synthetase